MLYRYGAAVVFREAERVDDGSVSERIRRLVSKPFAAPESEVLVYYGAADTCVGLATATVGDLIAACGDAG